MNRYGTELSERVSRDHDGTSCDRGNTRSKSDGRLRIEEDIWRGSEVGAI